MSYSEKIKAKKEQITKHQEEIKKRNEKIAKLKSEIKQLQAEQDNEFSQNFLNKLVELGITSEEERNALLSKIEDFAIEQEIQKSEESQREDIITTSENSDAVSSDKISQTEKVSETVTTTSATNHQNPYLQPNTINFKNSNS